MQNTAQLVQGNQAVADAAIYAGARFFAGCPITPSSEIAEVCSKQMPKVGSVYMQKSLRRKLTRKDAKPAAIAGMRVSGEYLQGRDRLTTAVIWQWKRFIRKRVSGACSV